MSTVTVAVATWKRPEYLKGCLEGVASQTRMPEEVIVVGRADDEAARIVASEASDRLPKLRWIEVNQPGHIPPIRTALEATATELIAFLDDDTEPEPGWLSALVGPFGEPKVACVGGRYTSTSQGNNPVVAAKDAGRFRWYGRFVGHFEDVESARAIDVDGVLEGNSAWRTDVLKALTFEPIFDDGDSLHYGLDLCQQAHAHGWRVCYVPAARAVHHWASRSGTPPRQDLVARNYAHARNLTFIAMRRFHGVRRVAFLAWWILVGERQAYGVATAAWDFAARGHTVLPTISAALHGRLDGLRAWRAASAHRE
jgi:GT2 family glycosyltransferase